ncbi:MAG: RHS repeat-associated core domain-containing protein [Carboxylicivirga sp.]|nr:RHS repeat-associated core domain-containing protein [Carboxylicivirga sp.]
MGFCLLWLSVLEIYRKFVSGVLETERTTVNISGDKKKIATAETLTIDQGSLTDNPTAVVRYQLDNHLGSASLELDETADIISYEEYHPFGTTSYRSGKTETETSQKRYKYVGKERDEETGLYYYGFRYYAAWLCRFVSVDPLQFEYPHYTPFQYAGNKPITYIDLDGLEEAEYYFHKDYLSADKVKLNDGNIEYLLPKWDKRVEINNKRSRYFYKIGEKKELVSTSYPSTKEFASELKDEIHSRGNLGEYTNGVLFEYEVESEYIEVNSPMTLKGGDRTNNGFNSMEDFDISKGVDLAQQFVKKVKPSSTISDPNKMFKVAKESFGGGDLDFKHEKNMALKDDVLYNINGVHYNRNEAGNFMWGYAMAMMNFSERQVDAIAHLGATILNNKRTFDEPWEVDAVLDGFNYFMTEKRVCGDEPCKPSIKYDMYSNPNKK